MKPIRPERVGKKKQEGSYQGEALKVFRMPFKVYGTVIPWKKYT